MNYTLTAAPDSRAATWPCGHSPLPDGPGTLLGCPTCSAAQVLYSSDGTAAAGRELLGQLCRLLALHGPMPLEPLAFLLFPDKEESIAATRAAVKVAQSHHRIVLRRGCISLP